MLLIKTWFENLQEGLNYLSYNDYKNPKYIGKISENEHIFSCDEYGIALDDVELFELPAGIQVIEERKLNYLLNLAKTEMANVDDLFERVDELVSKVSVGMTVLNVCHSPHDAFPVVIEKIDEKTGTLSVYEKSINRRYDISVLGIELS